MAAEAQEKKVKEEKKPKASAAVSAEAPKAAPPAAPPAPRVPADPRLRVLKKFHGKFLPKGILRDRFQAIMQRWNSGGNHGGVTVEELKSVLDGWKARHAKPQPRPPKA